jgi:hypothetical protein
VPLEVVEDAFLTLEIGRNRSPNFRLQPDSASANDSFFSLRLFDAEKNNDEVFIFEIQQSILNYILAIERPFGEVQRLANSATLIKRASKKFTKCCQK